MTFNQKGTQIRNDAKKLVLEFMRANEECSSAGQGLPQAVIFRDCGLQWNEYDNAKASWQQYWIAALLKDLEAEDKVKRDPITKKYRLAD